MTDSTTATDGNAIAHQLGAAKQQMLALVVAWSADEPHRIGEVLFVPPASRAPWIFGRGSEQPDDLGPRALLGRQRPAGVDPAGPLLAPKVSRTQNRATSPRFPSTRSAKSRPLPNRAGRPRAGPYRARTGRHAPIGGQLLLLCVKRSLKFAPQLPESCRTHDFPRFFFGEPDDYGIVGESPAIWSLRQRLSVIARREGHVLLRGQSGSGKELAAQALHRLSPRGARPLVARNAATIPDSLFDAELFGNLRDYPNRGTPERPGLVGQAGGSTLFLDEVGELPPNQQAHLLRALDRGEYHRLGESVARVSNFRLVAATSRPDSALKSDFLARFAFAVDVPALDERREDIPLLARSFLRSLTTRDPELVQRFATAPGGEPRVSLALILQLLNRSHPGNVRDIQALLLQSLVESGGGDLEPVRIPWPKAEQPPSHSLAAELAVEAKTSAIDTLPDDPRALTPGQIQDALDRHNGVIEATWRALTLKNRFALTRLIAKYGLEVRRRPGLHRSARRTTH